MTDAASETPLDFSMIREKIARSSEIFTRGENIYLLGSYTLRTQDPESGEYLYALGGTYGDYTVTVTLRGNTVRARCTCPYPHGGCKHIVAACLDIAHRQARARKAASDPGESGANGGPGAPVCLTPEEIRALALEGRSERARKEGLRLIPGETGKGPHVVRTREGAEYTVTVYSPVDRTGHCTCADFATNHLATCKHLLFAYTEMEKDRGFRDRSASEVFPFVHVIWSSRLQAPVCHYERVDDPELESTLRSLFSDKGVYTRSSIGALYRLYRDTDASGVVRFDRYLLERLEDILYRKEVARLERDFQPDYTFLRAVLYPYQREGIRFAVFRKAAILADEMGLGKTIQAIAVSVLKKRIFGIGKVLVVTPSSLKDQWKREIERFTDESAVIVSGGRARRQEIYRSDPSFFKITNYEAVLRDVLAIRAWQPDLVVLDEAQRIKSFETKTHEALMSVPRTHSLVMTGTPLENRLTDVYSIVQFADRQLLTPLWAFAANHMSMSRDGRHRVLGYRNLEAVRAKLRDLVIRRTRQEVFESLPDLIQNNFYLDLSEEQAKIHRGYLSALLPILNRKVLTPLDIKRIQQILQGMRMVCDSTFLIDRTTNVSPKLAELVPILRELVVDGGRKVVLFTEWTTMTYLIGKVLSELGIDFVEFTGKVPADKRPLIIRRFLDDPQCRVFLSTDAGGVGLNLQNADCVINFELPWNPARLNQRIGRVHRLGQKSAKINVINLVSKSSIEENVLAAIDRKQELFDAVLEDGADDVDMDAAKKTRFINQVRALLGEEPALPATDGTPGPDLDERTPHYLNPEIMKEREPVVDVAADEPAEAGGPLPSEDRVVPTAQVGQVETVLNHGLAFLNTLSQMATGKPLVAEGDRKAIEVDPVTGEVVLRFRLPGFSPPS